MLFIILNLSIIFTLLVIILFNVTNTKHQIIITLCSLVGFLLFKNIFDKMIKENKKNDYADNIYNLNIDDLKSKNDTQINKFNNTNGLKKEKCGCKCSCDCNTNAKKFVGGLEKPSVFSKETEELKNKLKFKNGLLLDKLENLEINDYSKFKKLVENNNKVYSFKDFHNHEISLKLNDSSDFENSIKQDNVDCTNDNSCVIKPSVYNLHKY